MPSLSSTATVTPEDSAAAAAAPSEDEPEPLRRQSSRLSTGSCGGEVSERVTRKLVFVGEAVRKASIKSGQTLRKTSLTLRSRAVAAAAGASVAVPPAIRPAGADVVPPDAQFTDG
eukprot:1503522-Prymnesium_polylepis.1